MTLTVPSRPPRVRVLCAAAVVLVVEAAYARSQARRPVEDDGRENVREVRHLVTMKRIEPDVAIFTVDREFRPVDPRMPMWIDRRLGLPPKAVVTSFAVRTIGDWRDGVLAESRSLGHLPRSVMARKTPVARPWAALRLETEPSNRELLRLTTAMTNPTPAIHVRYTLWEQAEPTQYGQRWRICSEYQADVPMVPPPGLRSSEDPDHLDCLALDERTPPRAEFTARYGVYPAANGWYWYLDLIAPQTIAPPTPEPGPVVFLIDASASQAEAGGLRAQLDVARAYLANTPKAKVEVILFNRSAERVFGRFVPASAFARLLPPELEKRALRNGSFLERALQLAANALNDLDKPGRIVILSDGAMRSGFGSQDAIAVLETVRRPPLVHLLFAYRAKEMEPMTAGREASELQAVVDRFGGAAYSVGLAKQMSLQVARAIVRRAVSPDRIESLTVRATDPGHKGSPLGLSHFHGRDDLSAKNAYAQWFGFSQEPPVKDLALEGWIWGRKLEFPLQIDPVFQRRMSRLATAQFEAVESLTYGEQPCRPIGATAADALAEKFLARHLEFRVAGDGVMPGIAEACCLPRHGCRLQVIGKGSGSAAPPGDPLFPNAQAAGLKGVADALVACGLVEEASGDVHGTVETIEREIVDISIEGPEEPRRCLEEALWNVSLPAEFNKHLWWRRRLSYPFSLAPRPEIRHEAAVPEKSGVAP